MNNPVASGYYHEEYCETLTLYCNDTMVGSFLTMVEKPPLSETFWSKKSDCARIIARLFLW